MTRRSRSRGFTVVELLIIVVVVGIIASALIPILLDTLEVSKQKRTMSDINLVGRAAQSWITDSVGAAAAGAATVPMEEFGDPVDVDTLRDLLVPNYIPAVPRFDAWGGDLEYRFNLADLSASRLISIRSSGRDKAFETDTYVIEPFDPRSFDRDIVWVDGVFVRWPQKLE